MSLRLGQGQGLGRFQGRRHVEQPQPRHRPRRALDPVRIGDLAAQHLVAAADAQHVAAAAHMRGEVDVPAVGAEIGEVGAGGFRAGDQHQRRRRPGSARPGSTMSTTTPGSADKRVEVVEIGDPRQPRHGDLHARSRAAALPGPSRLPPAAARRRRTTAARRARASRCAARSRARPPRTARHRRETC